MTRKKPRRPDSIDPHEIESEGLPSASGFDAEFRCPGKRALEKRLPQQAETAVTRSGQRIHCALQKGDFSKLSDTNARTARRVAFAESEIVHEYELEGAVVTFEERAWDFDDELRHTWSGRVDRYDWLPSQRRLLVIDDKTGWGIPPPISDNWQVRSEAALLSERLGAEETIAALIHPHHPFELWQARRYTPTQMQHLLDVVRENVRIIGLPDQPRIPGPWQCQWCKAKGICPEYKADAKALDAAIAAEAKDEGFTAINARSPDERADHVRAINQRMKDQKLLLEQYVYLLGKDPDAITGWRLARKVTRHCADEGEVIALVRKEYGDELADSCLEFSLKLFQKKLAERSTEAEAFAEVRRVLGPLLQLKKGEPYLEEARSL
jgi:PD-(D/E)XK nuclease superfamily